MQKSSRTISRSILSQISFSLYIANPFNLSCSIVDHKQFFNSLSLEKLFSADAAVTGIVKRIRYAIEIFG
jgi:hypothetical protein